MMDVSRSLMFNIDARSPMLSTLFVHCMQKTCEDANGSSVFNVNECITSLTV